MAANGSLIVIQFGASGSEKSVLAQTSLSFGLSRNEIVQASKDTDFNDKIAGKLDASMSFEVLAALDSDESSKDGLKFLQDSILNKTVEEFRIVQVDGELTQAPIVGSRIIKGKGFLSAVDMSAPDDDNTTASCTLSVSEKPDLSAVVPAP